MSAVISLRRSSISSETFFVLSTSNEKEARKAYNLEGGITKFVYIYICKYIHICFVHAKNGLEIMFNILESWTLHLMNVVKCLRQTGDIIN